MKIHSNLRRDSLLALLSLLLLHVGTCQAQSSMSTIIVAVPVTVFAFVVMAIIMTLCICFWVCFCVQMAKQRQLFNGAPANARARYTPYVHNQRPYQDRAAQLAGSYSAQGYVVPSTTSAGVSSPQTQQIYPGQGYVPPSTVTVPSALPLAPPGATQSQTAIPLATQATSEPVSLPEATLHQGDAPPAYEEAIEMKTVDIADQDELQT